MAKDRISSMRSSKFAKLQKWNEEEERKDGDFLSELDNDDLFPVDELQTLRISDTQIPNPTPPIRNKKSRPSLSPGMFMQYTEKQDEELSFDEDVEDRLNVENLRLNQMKHAYPDLDHKFLPANTSSPIRRRSLSDYSEDTETDITELNDEDFEEIDDIFGKEESGIYSSGGKDSHRGEFSKASEILAKKKVQLQKEADYEDEELVQRYKGHHGDEVNTLKLKDLQRFQQESNLEKDALENERTVNYEYTRDDFESFEDGFEPNSPGKIEPERLRQFQTSATDGRRIQHKVSMPVFPNSLKPSKQSKFKSTMDLAGILEKNDHPVFNNSNKLIRKLDRMPSFHSRKGLQAALEDDEALDYNMELKKQELLEKYMEITEKQKQIRSSPKKKLSSMKSIGPSKRGVGLVRYLNDKSAVPAVSPSVKMKFNAKSKRWEGNDHELLRFDEEEHPSSRKQPSLITLKEFDKRGDTFKGHMKFDAENLRWINLDERDEVENDVFDDLPDLVPNDIPNYKTAAKNFLSDRGVSTFTQRTVLSVSSDRSSALSATAGDEFVLGDKLLAKFQREELKVRKKTHHWFGSNEHYRTDRQKPFESEYFWEIRKMVMDNDSPNE